jgi:hypothetical protein
LAIADQTGRWRWRRRHPSLASFSSGTTNSSASRRSLAHCTFGPMDSPSTFRCTRCSRRIRSVFTYETPFVATPRLHQSRPGLFGVPSLCFSPASRRARPGEPRHCWGHIPDERSAAFDELDSSTWPEVASASPPGSAIRGGLPHALSDHDPAFYQTADRNAQRALESAREAERSQGSSRDCHVPTAPSGGVCV